MPEPALDGADVRILRALQADGRLTNLDLAQRVDLSASPCWRRVRRLEESGVIRGYAAVIDRKKAGLGVLAFVRVGIDRHSDADAQRFEAEVAACRKLWPATRLRARPTFCSRWSRTISMLMPSSP